MPPSSHPSIFHIWGILAPHLAMQQVLAQQDPGNSNYPEEKLREESKL